MKTTDSSITRGRLLWSAAVVVAASLPHWLMVPAWMPVLLCISIGWRLAVLHLGWRLPRKPFRLLLACLAFVGVLVEYGTINGVQAGSALLVVMVALKLLEAETQRDELVLMIISYFLVFAILLDRQSFWTAMYLLGFVWFTTVGLLQLGRRGPLLRSFGMARLAGRLLLQALPIMLVLFLLFPRLPGPLWALPTSSSAATTGLSDTMSPGDITNLGLSDEVAFRVEFLGAPPRAERLYWRGPVLSSFNGRTWSRQRGMRRRAQDTIEYRGAATEYRVMLEPDERGWLFALDMPREWSDIPNIAMGSDYQLRIGFGQPPVSRLDYRVTSHTEYLAREPITDGERGYYTRLPEDGNPRTRALATAWRERASTPRAIVDEALALFRNEPFYYTLTPPPLGKDAADEFLFETREGFCEHYASAFAVMMRAAGVPTRIVTGYQGGELNTVGDYYIVRQSDAHAWTEVWLEGSGWVRVDPTAAVAPERIEFGSSRRALSGDVAPGSIVGRIGWLRKAMLIWDAADTYWYSWVIGYGQAMQRMTLRNFGIDATDWRTLILYAAGGTAALLAMLAAWVAWSQRRRKPTDPAAACYAELCRRLDRRRVAPRRPGESPLDYAARAGLALPAAAGAIRQIVTTYLRARYEPDPDRKALARLRALVKRFRPAAARGRGTTPPRAPASPETGSRATAPASMSN